MEKQPELLRLTSWKTIAMMVGIYSDINLDRALKTIGKVDVAKSSSMIQKSKQGMQYAKGLLN